MESKGLNLDHQIAGAIANEQTSGRMDEKTEYVSKSRENPLVLYGILIFPRPGAMAS
jgi:hypothetical protein